MQVNACRTNTACFTKPVPKIRWQLNAPSESPCWSLVCTKDGTRGFSTSTLCCRPATPGRNTPFILYRRTWLHDTSFVSGSDEAGCRALLHVASPTDWLIPPSHDRLQRGRQRHFEDRLNAAPNDSCCKDAGHVLPSIGWVNESPMDGCSRPADHKISAAGWLKELANESRSR